MNSLLRLSNTMNFLGEPPSLMSDSFSRRVAIVEALGPSSTKYPVGSMSSHTRNELFVQRFTNRSSYSSRSMTVRSQLIASAPSVPGRTASQ